MSALYGGVSHEAAKTIGADVRLVVHPRGRHGFDLGPGDERTKAILRQAVAFARTALAVR